MIALLLLAVVVLILLNAFFVAAEFALVRSRKAHLQTVGAFLLGLPPDIAIA